MLPFILKKLWNAKTNPLPRRRTKNPPPTFEVLEERALPATLTVGPMHEFPTISAALAAAHANATIDVFPGIYNEDIIISKNGIQLNAEGQGVIIQPASVGPVTLDSVDIGGAAIDIYANKVTVNGFTIDGSMDSDGNLVAGIRVIEGGSAAIKNNTVQGMVNGPADTNVDIQVGTSQVGGGQGGGTAAIVNNTIVSYAGAGVLVDGTKAEALIKDNTITGLGTANGGVTEYGVQVSNGAGAAIIGNTITGNTISGSAGAPNNPAATSAGIFIYNDSGRGIIASSNTITGNDDGILVQSSNGSFSAGIVIAGNTIQQNYGYAGIFVLSSNGVEVVYNNVSNNTTFNGIALNDTSYVLVDANSLDNNGTSGSESDGIYDLSGNFDQIVANNSNSNSGNGINIQSSADDVLYDNATKSNTLSGIQDLDGINNIIWKGSSSNNTQDGIVLTGTTGDMVLSISLTNNGGYGLHLEGAVNTFIAGISTSGNAAGSIEIDSASTGTVQYSSLVFPLHKYGLFNGFHLGFSFDGFYSIAGFAQHRFSF